MRIHFNLSCPQQRLTQSDYDIDITRKEGSAAAFQTVPPHSINMDYTVKIEQEQAARWSTDELIAAYRGLKMASRRLSSSVVTANLATCIREMRLRVNAGIMLYYLALDNGFPYQESSKYGLQAMDKDNITIRLFPTRAEAEEFATLINKRTNTACANSGRQEHDIVHLEALGVSESLDARTALARMGVHSVLFGKAKDGEAEFSLQARTLIGVDNEDEINYYAIAPEAYALNCLINQAVDESRPEAEIEDYRLCACIAAASARSAVAISQEVFDAGDGEPFTLELNGVKYLELFTDWLSMLDALEPPAAPDGKSPVYLAVGNWDDILTFGLPVILNRSICIDADSTFKLGIYTKRALMALEVVADQYGLDMDADGEQEHCVDILNDIRRAAPVCEEFYKALDPYMSAGEDRLGKGSNVAPVSGEETVAVKGITAKKLIDTGLCKNAAAAYHVLSLLYNDPDGAHMAAFESAELYE